METGAPDESLPALDAAAEIEALLRRVAANGLDLDRRAHWTLLEGSPLSIVITRPDGSIAYSNPSAHRMHGVSRETYDGSNIIDFYRDPAERDRVYETVRRDGRLLNYELELLRGDGTPVWALISTHTLQTSQGPLLFVWASDITERKRLEGELAHERALLLEKTNTLETLLENLQQGVIQFDQDDRVVAYNSRVHELLALPAPLDGLSLHSLRAYQESIGEFGTDQDGIGTSWRIEDFRRYRSEADGSTVYERTRPNGLVLEIRSNPTTRGGWVRSYSDITERHRAAQEIVAARDSAERALAELQDAQDNLVRSERLASLGGLVAGIAHDTSTPIGVALTAATLLADRTAAMSALVAGGRARRSDIARYTAVAAEMAQQLVANITRAAELIQSFKQVAVDRTSGDRRAFKLRPFIEEVLLSLRPRLEPARHAVVVDCPDDLALDGYPGALSQVLTNLAVNSLVHAFDPGCTGTIRIAARSVADDTRDDVVVTFSDDGKGIPVEHQARIFDPFFTTRREAGGAGLGLNVVQDIVTATLGGRIDVISAPGLGTRFEIRFPRVLPDAREGGAGA